MADPDGLMVVINTCDPHLISGSTPAGWHSGLLQWSEMGVNILYIFVYMLY